MISLNDVLLAMSNIPVDDPIAEIWGRGLQGGYKIIEYTGALPIAINANGDMLIDYRIYGTDGGVGVATENLCPDAFEQGSIELNGVAVDSDVCIRIRNINVQANTAYRFTSNNYTRLIFGYNGTNPIGVILDAYQNAVKNVTFTTNSNVNKLAIVLMNTANYSTSTVIRPEDVENAMLTKGSAVPTSYIPYGYKLPMVVQSANLFDVNARDVDKGFISKTRLNSDGTTQNAYSFNVSEYIAVHPETSYYFRKISAIINFGPSECFYDSEKNFISAYTPRFEESFTVTTPANAAYIRVSYRNDYSEQMITEGAEPPSTYIPYSRTDTPVYIGENQLDSIEGVADYVDKASGKIVRMIGEYTFTGAELVGDCGSYGACWFYTNDMSPKAISTYDTITMRCDHPKLTAVANRGITLWGRSDLPDDVCGFREDYTQVVFRSTATFANAEECKAYLKAQYDNGTPVKISYWLKTPIEEDPPVPLPEIPTIDGTTIIDYDGDPKPSQMYVKYRR